MSRCPAPRRSSAAAANGGFTVDWFYQISSNFLHKLNDVFVNQLMLATHLQREANTGQMSPAPLRANPAGHPGLPFEDDASRSLPKPAHT
jgi:hypothetical protein